MLVVSNINIATDLQTMEPAAFLKSTIKEPTLNLNNDYRYLKTGYYVSMHAEILGNKVIPSSESIIDANRIPIFLLKASKAGIPTVPYIMTDSIKQMIGKYGFPVVVFAVNPFSYNGYRIARNRSGLYRVVKSLGMNYKFAVCCQPLEGQMISFKSIFGKCEMNREIRILSEKVYKTFHIPICRLHVQSTQENARLSGLQPLKKEEITQSDMKIISETLSGIFETGDSSVV